MKKYHVSYYVLMEFDAETSSKAEATLARHCPTIEELEESVGKVRSTQWTVTELTPEDAKSFSGPTE